jgi:hypothetical protein
MAISGCASSAMASRVFPVGDQPKRLIPHHEMGVAMAPIVRAKRAASIMVA